MHWPGSFPALRTGTKAAPSLNAIIGPSKNPRASRPTTTSILFVPAMPMVCDVIWWTKWVMSASKARGSRRMGNMSRKTIPCVVVSVANDRRRTTDLLRKVCVRCKMLFDKINVGHGQDAKILKFPKKRGGFDLAKTFPHRP